MVQISADERSLERRSQDERIAAEPELAAPKLVPDAKPQPAEAHLAQTGKRPRALLGIVENGLVRPLDSSEKLSENAHVIIVTSESF